MRDAATRKERAIFIKELCDLVTNVDDDRNYFKRLLWANQWIATQLMEFESDFDDEAQENKEE